MIRFLNTQEIIDIHDLIINSFGGSYGIRDLGLLVSAVEIPKATMFKKLLHLTLFDQAAAYLFHICKNHSFIDRNKRTAVVSALAFLEDNEILLQFDPIGHVQTSFFRTGLTCPSSFLVLYISSPFRIIPCVERPTVG